MLDLIIRGGTVVTPAGAKEADVGVAGEAVAVLGSPASLPSEAARVINATGKFVLPGGIEPHAHLGIPVQERWAGRPGVLTQPPEAGTRAAAFGGVTTVVDFSSDLRLSPQDTAPDDPIMVQHEARVAQFAGRSHTDFTFHHILSGEVSPETIAEIPEAVQAGVASFKIFTTFGPARVPYGHLASIFQTVGKAGGIMAVHAEDDDIVTYMEAKLKREGRDQGHNLHLVHSNLSEDLAFRKVIRLAEHTGTGIYFVHTTAGEGVRAIADARGHLQPVYGEALHNYLEFTADHYREPEGTKIHTYPAIKYAADRDALQEGLADGSLSTTATDDYTTNKDVKLSGNTVETVCGGHNGIETRFAVTYAKLAATGRVSLERFADITSSNAARILGLYPRKGAVSVGSDADIVIFDPEDTRTLTLDGLHSDSDYSIWEGFECQGYPVTTILRGKVVVEDGKLTGSPSDGRWVARKVAPEVLAHPVC